MRISWKTVAAAFIVTATAAAAAPVNFSGTWVFKPERSRNVGMMAAMQYTSVIAQTGEVLSTHDVTVFQGQAQTLDTRYDLTGRTVDNEAPPPTGGQARTVTHWDGSHLVTQWSSAGAIAGTTVVRTETRWLSEDSKTMSVESAREGRPPVVLVFERK
jgi:hypothetical protein